MVTVRAISLARRPFDVGPCDSGRLAAIGGKPAGGQAQHQEECGRDNRGAQHVLRIDDAVDPPRGIDGERVRGEHGIAEQDQHQRWRDDHAQCACNRDRRVAQGRRQPRRVEARLDGARKRQDAGADRPAHRPQQCTQPQSRHHGRTGSARQQPQQCTEHRRRDGQAIEQHAHQNIERQSLQQIAFEQIDETAGQGPEQRQRHAPARDRGHTTEHGCEYQHGISRQSRQDQSHADECKQDQTEARHHRSSSPLGLIMSSTMAARTPAANSQSASLTIK